VTASALKASVLALGWALAAYAQAGVQSPRPARVGLIHLQQAIVSTKDGQKAASETQQASPERRQEVLQKLIERMGSVLAKYARDKGYDLILDISSAETQVLYFGQGFDITKDFVAFYEQNAPPATGAAAASERPVLPSAAASSTPGGTEKGSAPISAEEKSIINQILALGAGGRAVIRDLLPPARDEQGRMRFSIGGPAPGTAVLTFEEDQATGRPAVKSNITLFSFSGADFEGKLPDLSELTEGSVVRFSGRIALKGYVFAGDRSDPLSFVALPREGLVHLKGKGAVTSSDGRITKF